MNLAEPIDIRTGRPFDRRTHYNHPPIERASTGGRARGLLGGLFGGCMMAAQSRSPSYDVQDYVGWGTSDLVAMWDGIRNVGATAAHDSSATTWVDLTGNGNSVTLPSGVTWSADASEWADAAMKSASLSNFSIGGTTPFTVELVYSATSYNSQVVFTVRYFTGGRGAFYVPAFSRFCVGGNTTTYSAIANSARHSVSGRFDGDATCNRSIDGVEQTATAPYSTTYSASSDVVFNGLYGTVYSKQSSISSIRIYNRALTAAEVAANYAVDKERFGLT